MNHANNPITTQLNEPVPMWFLTKLIIVRSRNILSTSIRSVKQVAIFPKHPRSSGASIYVNSSFFFILLFPNPESKSLCIPAHSQYRICFSHSPSAHTARKAPRRKRFSSRDSLLQPFLPLQGQKHPVLNLSCPCQNPRSCCTALPLFH